MNARDGLDFSINVYFVDDKKDDNELKHQLKHPLLKSFIILQLIEKTELCFKELDEIISTTITVQNKKYNIRLVINSSSSSSIDFPYSLSLSSPFVFHFPTDQPQTSNKKDQQNKKITVGGLDKEYEQVKKTILQMIEYKENNISSGIIIHGLSGTGKTRLIQTVLQDLEINSKNIQIIHASMFNSKIYGQNEVKLKQLFFQGNTTSSNRFVILEDLDQLIPSTQLIEQSVVSHKGGKRFISTLLHCLDECPKKRIIVIGITNQFNRLDSAVTRSGRLDQLVLECPIPNENQRFEILKCICNQCNIESNIEIIEKIASITHGFVGSDLKSLCNEAILQYFLKVTTNIDTAEKESNKVVLGLEHFEQALNHVKPSAIRHILVEVPKVFWNDIGGQSNVKQSLKECVEWPFKYDQHFKRMKIRPPRGVLLYGPPGCSKTLMAKALATEAKLNFLAVRGPELFSKWVGESEKAVQQIFAKARQAAPCIIFFDEIDGLGVARGSSGGNSVGDRVLSQLLNELDGVDPLQGVTVIAATNRPDLLDEAFLRPGRIDRMLYVSPPDLEARIEIIKINLKKMSHNISIDQVKQLATTTENYSGAEMSALCREAAYLALHENIHAEFVEFKHFEEALQTVKPRITQDMLEFYKDFASKHRA
ncbi:hypothetical protein ABK040_010281 [Willaertia magna]